MKNLIFIFLLFTNFLFSQKFDAIYKVDYKPQTENSKTKTELMLLKIRGDESEYLNYDQFRMDSLGRIKNYQLVNNLEKPNLKFKIFKDLSKKQQFFCGNFNQFDFCYKEKNEIIWKILPSEWLFETYKVQEATADFGYRKWHAFFTTEIPLFDGPYKFCGLPGLILKIFSEDGDYNFELASLQKNDEIFENLIIQKANISEDKIKKRLNKFLKYPDIQTVTYKSDFGDTFAYEFSGKKDKNFYENQNFLQNILNQYNNYIEKDFPIINLNF